jgi:hypothetical protein
MALLSIPEGADDLGFAQFVLVGLECNGCGCTLAHYGDDDGPSRTEDEDRQANRPFGNSQPEVREWAERRGWRHPLDGPHDQYDVCPACKEV